MLKYAVHIIISLLLFSCNSQKNAVRKSESDFNTEIRQTQNDSTRSESQIEINNETAKQEDETAYVRTTYYDSLGNIRRISEEWRHSGRIELSLYKGFLQHFSMTGSSVVDTVNHNFRMINSEDVKLKSDSRPIQKTEWFWVIAGLAAAVIIYIVIKKRL